MSLEREIEEKYEKLQSILKEMQGAVIAFSGGVDSTLLLKVAHDVLGDCALALIGRSAIHPARETQEAVDIAEQLGVRYRLVDTSELADPSFLANPRDRCYYCKKGILKLFRQIAEKEGLSFLIEGSNADDTRDYRPGNRAVLEAGARSPLREAGLRKQEIRRLSRHLGLSTADKPSFPCLATRIPYGTPVTEKRLTRVDRIEDTLRGLGFRVFRARLHDEITVRIEMPSDEWPLLQDPTVRERLITVLKNAGFLHITLDLQGYRMGSMNEGMPGAKG